MGYDACIIGAGVVGLSIAFELSRYNLDVVVVEKENDIACGATKANSGIVHAGYDPLPGTLKAKLNVEGNPLIKAFCKRFNVPLINSGSLVVAMEGEEKKVEELAERAEKNGVKAKIMERDEILRVEPNVNKDASLALFAPSASIVDPFLLSLALAENAVLNGVKLVLNNEVIDIVEKGGGFKVKGKRKTLNANFIVNSSGINSDEVARFSGEKYSIIPRKGEYLVLDKEFGNVVKHVLFPVPTKESKGILVTPTTDGNLMVGPNAHETKKDDLSNTAEGIEEIFMGGKKLVPSISKEWVISQFSGLRASVDGRDFIISMKDNFINLVGIDSPGLASSLAIARRVVSMLKERGLKMKKKRRLTYKKIKTPFSKLSWEERERMIKKDESYGRVVCRCNFVTEGEIRDCLRSTVPARDMDGIKRRLRVMMGRCQGSFCMAKIMEIFVKETGNGMDEVTKCGSGSKLFPIKKWCS